MKPTLVKIGRWTIVASIVVGSLFALYGSLFFFPYPLFPHHVEVAGFEVFSDREIPADLEAAIEDARRRVDAMELSRGETTLRLFICNSERKYVTLSRLAGKRHAGQALVITAAGNAFFSIHGIESIGQRNRGSPVHSRLEGSLSAAIAHEFAHVLLSAKVGRRDERRIPTWKSEGYADFMAHRGSAASDPEYDLRNRISYLLDESHWRPPVTTYDRRHVRWHVLVEYLFTVRGIRLAELLADDVMESSAWSEMMVWYRETAQ